MKGRGFSLLAILCAVALTTLAACADSSTAPRVVHQGSTVRFEIVPGEGDTVWKEWCYPTTLPTGEEVIYCKRIPLY